MTQLINFKDEKPPIDKEIIFHFSPGYQSIAKYQGGTKMQFAEGSGFITLDLVRDFPASDQKFYKWELRHQLPNNSQS